MVLRRTVLLVATSVFALLALSGCRSAPPAVEGPMDVPMEAPHRDTTASVLLPDDDPMLSRQDASGNSPDEAVLAYIEALDRGDWDAAYSMTASPAVDYSVAEQEWRAAEERYEDFIVREVRVSDDETAYVRVTYEVWTTPPVGNPYAVVIERPGEWWSVHKVAGEWKVSWLPRQ